MNLNFKRSASFLLALVMIFSLFPSFGVHAHAEDTVEEFPVQYTVRFLDEDGTELQSSLVDAGAIPEYTGEPLYKEGYVFADWTPALAEVTANADYTAVYTAVQPASEEPSEEPEEPSEEPEVTSYTVTFLNHDGTVLQSGAVNAGETPIYGGETPVKAEDETNTYAFSGWTPEVAAVSANASYTAVFTATAKTPAQPETPADPEEPEVPEEPEDPEQTPVEPEVPEEPVYSEAYLAIQTMIDKCLNYWVGGTAATQAEIEAAVAAMNNDELWMAQVEVYDINAEAENTLTQEEITLLTENNSVFGAFTQEVNKYLAGPGQQADVTSHSNQKLGISYTGSSVIVSASGTTMKVEAPSVKIFYWWNANETTVTFTNKYDVEATLSFDVKISETPGTVTVDSQKLTTLGTTHFDLKIAGGGNTKVKITGTATANAKTVVEFLNLSLTPNVDSTVKATFAVPEHGSYTVTCGTSQATLTSGGAAQTLENEAIIQYTLVADPGTGNKFVGWYDETSDKYLGLTTTLTNVQFTKDTTVHAVIVPQDTPVFKISDMYKTDLKDAVDYAVAKSIKQITLVDDGAIKDTSKTYNIPSGYTLLIPRDTKYTAHKDSPEILGEVANASEVPAPSAFLTLTLAEGVNLTVDGTLEVEGKQKTMQGGNAYSGQVCDTYGAIYMEDGSRITVNGTLYAWGYIYGSGASTEGTITTGSSAKVYEFIQVPDFPGGTNLSGFVDSSTSDDANGDGDKTNDYIMSFPFSQYYIQNIEVPLTINAGAKEYVRTTMTMSKMDIGTAIEFIGSGGMFRPGTGASVTKDYDPFTDRLVFDIDGNLELRGLALDMSGTWYSGALKLIIGTDKIDSANYILSLNSNITVNINSGTTSISQNVSLLPGVELNIATGATVQLNSSGSDKLNANGTGGYNVYAYDNEDWGDNVFASPAAKLVAARYSPTPGRKVRTAADLKDVQIDVNGTIIADGFLYTTEHGAAVISSGKTGKIVLNNGAGNATLAHRLDGACKAATQPIVSAKLKNGNGTYRETAGAAAGDVFVYCAECNRWYKQSENHQIPVFWIVNGVEQGHTDICVDTIPVFPGETPTKASDATNHYTFAGWATSADGEALKELPPVTQEAAYNAVFKAEAHTYTLDTSKGTNGYTWSADGKTCNAHGKCSCGYTKDFAATVTSKVTTTATCKTPEVVTWTATFSGITGATTQTKAIIGQVNSSNHTGNNQTGVGYKDSTCAAEGYTGDTVCECGTTVAKGTVIPKKDHTYALTGYTWSTDGKTCTANAKCSGCTATTTATGSITSAVKTPATCTVKGTTTYTATFAATWATTQTKDVQDIPVADHSFTTKASTTVHTPGNCQTETLYKAQCDNCSAISDTVTVKGQKVANEHTSSEIAYKNITDETHDEYHKCCDTLIDDLVEHTYTDGACACGKEEPAKGMKGDVDVDNDVDMNDAVALLQYVLKDLDITDPVALANAEVTNDEALTMNDAVKIMQYVLKDIDSLD